MQMKLTFFSVLIEKINIILVTLFMFVFNTCIIFDFSKHFRPLLQFI